MARIRISTCGVVCEFCPRHRIGKCTGCNPNPYCGMPDCAEKKGVEYCFECEEFPCPRHYGKRNNLVIYDKNWLDFIKKEIQNGH